MLMKHENYNMEYKSTKVPQEEWNYIAAMQH